MNNYFSNQKGNSYLKLILIFFVLVLAIFAIFFLIQFVQKKKAAREVKEEAPVSATSTEEKEYVLPSAKESGGQEISSTTSFSDAAEKYYPGDFYRAPSAPADFAALYSLPLNTKTDIANYYDLSRKINLDKVLTDLDSNGFAIIDNPFSGANDFFAAYDALDSRQIPPLITMDFLTYYFQNITKLAYKKIESAVFYNSLWQINKKLYETAKVRYEKRLAESGLANDPILEGARRELVFLAVSLSLLQPQKDQIEEAAGLDGDGKFSSNEAEEFSFSLPEYLNKDVSAELALIRSASGSAKSPVLLYEKDYADFFAPAEYKTNERLKNFYLSSRWLNSIWPLYARGENCPDCLLDRDDWRVSFYASLLLADDLASSQDLKNQWARIYKIKSFFTGLRNDLNYLHYRTALDNVFGAGNKAADNLVGDDFENSLSVLADEIAGFEFPLMEGGRASDSLADRPQIGLKMLAKAWWPNDYIFQNLTATSVGSYLGNLAEAKKVPTACADKKKSERCAPAAIDIINLAIAGDSVDSPDTAYEFYAGQIDFLKKELADFTPASWHNNNFWLNLDLIKKDFAAPVAVRPVFARTEDYRQRDLSRSMAAWVNFQLPPDEFVISDSNSSRLGGGRENELLSYGYIEPNQVLAGELSANARMIIDFLSALKISDFSDAALYDLRKLKENLIGAEKIIKKEASGEVLADEDYKFISNLYQEFSVIQAGGKILDISGAWPLYKMREDISGIKILLVVYDRGGEKIIAAGPIFNYKETRTGAKK